MQLLWIGCLESEEEFVEKAKKGYNLASAQVSQENIVEGIEQASNMCFDSINGSVLPAFPKYKDKVVKKTVWNHAGNAYDVSVGYANYLYINRFLCKKSMIKEAKKWIKNRYEGNGLVVFVYSMRSAPMATACYIKKHIPNAKVYLIVTDLPQYMTLNQSSVRKFLKKIDWINIKHLQKKMDGFILYAGKMAQFLKIPDGKWLLMEGSYDGITFDDYKFEKKKSVMYSGKTDKEYGIGQLLDAFRTIKDDKMELWITGGGNADELIREAASVDNRIKFFGFLPNREDVLKLQRQASLLVNMRLPSEPASAYCFPSKLFEYMVTGTCVLSFDIEGIPSEYKKYLVMTNEDSLAKDISDFFDKTDEERANIANGARDFILNNKTKDLQGKRIWGFVCK